MPRKRRITENALVISAESGELLDTINAGESISPETNITDRQKESYLKTLEAALFYNEVKQNSRKHGGFTILTIGKTLANLNPATVGRLIFLSTFLEFNSQRLIYSKRPMLKDDLKDVLKLGKTAKNQFFNECENAGIIEDHGKEGLFLNELFFRHETKENEWIKLYHNTIQDLYNRMLPTYHKYFGFLAQCLCYVNLEWNTLCYNPNEKDSSKVEFMTLREFCKEIHYDYHNATRLEDALTGLWFEWDGGKQALCKMIPIDTEHGKEKGIAINPHLIFHGTDFDKVEVLAMYFTPRKAKRKMQRESE